MRTHTSVKIVAKETQREKALEQIKDLLKHIDSYINGTRPKRTSILVGIMFRFTNMDNKALSKIERDALLAIKNLYETERILWDGQERHSINRDQARELSSFLRDEISELTIKIRQFYVSPKDRAWRDVRMSEPSSSDDYGMVKDAYEKMVNMLKDAPVDETPRRRVK